MEPGAVAAVVQSGGETVWQVSLPPTGEQARGLLLLFVAPLQTGGCLQACCAQRVTRTPLPPPPPPSPHLAAGRPSDSVAQLKREAMAWMTSYLQAKQMDTDEGEAGGADGRGGERGGAALPGNQTGAALLHRNTPPPPASLLPPLLAAVDLMEQAISDDEGAGSGKGSGKGKGQQQQGKGGRKRKQQQSPAAAAAAGGT